MDTLRSILNKAKGSLGNGWLYLPANEVWSLETLGTIIDIDELSEDEVDEEGVPISAKERNLIATLESSIIEDIVSYAQDIGVPVTDELLLESFQYYFDHDAFLPEPGFKPLPREEAIMKMDRDFYELLGPERLDAHCQKFGCKRGAVEMSVFCKVHHFESVQKKKCPFND